MDDRISDLVDKARVATLGTISASGAPHLVPVVFARLNGRLVTAVDGKPKKGTPLARIANILRDPRVSLLIHNYTEDWSGLSWVRFDGEASIAHDGDEFLEALVALRERYSQYEAVDLSGPVISITVERTAAWEADPH